MNRYHLASISSMTILLASVVLTSIPFVHSQEQTKGDSWSSINAALGNIEKLTGKNDTATQSALDQLAAAKSQYDEVFRPAVADLDPPTEQLVESAFAELERAVEVGNILNVTLNKQVVDKTIYKIAFLNIEEELLEGEVDEAAEWFTVMTKKFNYAQNPSEASNAMSELQENQTRVAELTPVILEDLRALFLLKVKEEIAESLEAQGKQPSDNASAQKFAVEGIGYYRTIQPDVRKKLGVEQEATLFSELEEFLESAKAGNLADMNRESDEINALLLAYEGKEASGIAASINEIIDLLQLVNIEYIDSVRDGQVIDQEEYDEAIAFVTRAQEKFDTIQMGLIELGAEETQEVEEDLIKIATMVQNKDDPQNVSDAVQHAQSELQALLEASGGEAGRIGGWEYIDQIKVLLDEVVTKYNSGSYDEARTIAREAYLDNYEFIEDDIAQEDRNLMEKIEIDMRVELVEMIDERKPSAEIESHVEMIKTDLEVARAVVTPEFSLASVTLATVSATVIAGTFYARRKGF
ncbi:MAG: hypothetical protein MN733_35030 [Nitrososphaera sp.]|nr:hypothetical protein [Nitrososphaera sp.]